MNRDGAVDETRSPDMEELELLQPFSLVRKVDERGALLPLDFDALPFLVRRVFTVSGVPPGTRRGGHGHLRGIQLLVCVQGRIELRARAGVKTSKLMLSPDGSGALLSAGVWCEQCYLAPDSVLLVLASESYDPGSYFVDPEPQ